MSPTHEGDRMPTTEPTTQSTHYPEAWQLARLDALRAIDSYVRTTRFMGGEGINPFDEVRLAHYVLDDADLLDDSTGEETR